MREREDVVVRIQTPLPMGVAGALMQAVGALYPTAQIATGSKNRHWRPESLSMVIPGADVYPDPKPLGKRAAAAMRKEAEAEDPDLEPDALGFRDGVLVVAPPDELAMRLGAVMSMFLDSYADGTNYVEWSIASREAPDAPPLVLHAAYSKGQTPAALRQRAERRAEALAACLRDLVHVATGDHPLGEADELVGRARALLDREPSID